MYLWLYFRYWNKCKFQLIKGMFHGTVISSGIEIFHTVCIDKRSGECFSMYLEGLHRASRRNYIPAAWITINIYYIYYNINVYYIYNSFHKRSIQNLKEDLCNAYNENKCVIHYLNILINTLCLNTTIKRTSNSTKKNKMKRRTELNGNTCIT